MGIIASCWNRAGQNELSGSSSFQTPLKVEFPSMQSRRIEATSWGREWLPRMSGGAGERCGPLFLTRVSPLILPADSAEGGASVELVGAVVESGPGL